MNPSSRRKQLHNYLEVANDKKIKAIYLMIENEIKETNFTYSEELKTELDNRYHDYKNGNAKMITSAESKRKINKLLKGTNK